jgi:chitinase
MATNQPPLYQRFTALKQKQPGLKTWFSVGGWDFNDPGATQSTFSQLAASPVAQDAFFNSVASYLTQYGFDGVDLDWYGPPSLFCLLCGALSRLVRLTTFREYPTAPDRSGSPADLVNYVSFLQNFRSFLDSMGGSYGLSITIPSSYWYMRGFDIVNLVKTVDWVCSP